MIRALVASLALTAVAVSAFNPARCSDIFNTAEFTYNLIARCYEYESDGTESTTTVNIVLTPEETSSGNTYLVYVWNIQGEATWALSQLTPSTGAFTPVASTAAVEFAGWMRYTPMPSIQSETITVTFDGSAGTEEVPVHFGITVVTEPAVPATRTASTTERVSFAVLPGTVVTNPVWNIDAPFTSERYIIQETVAYAAGRFDNAFDATGAFTTSLTAATTTPAFIDSTTVRTTFDMISRPDGNTQTFELSSGTFTTAAHDFVANGPEVEGTFWFTAREYPVASTSGDTVVSGTPSIVMLDVPPLWTAAESTILSADDTAVVTIEYAMNPEAESAISSAVPPTAAMPPSIDDPMAGYATYSLVAPTAPRFPTRIFAKVSADSPTETVVMTSVLAVPGECASYVDCRKDEDEHPSPRGGLSANDDVTRFRHCALVPQAADPTAAMARCVECLADCDCGAGQFCYSDPGVCRYSTTGDFYTCDPFSRDRLGVCVDKDPTGQIIGAGCRATSTIARSTSTAGMIPHVQTYEAGIEAATGLFATVGSPESLPLNDEGARVDRVPDGGAGFCGRARFFNSSNTDLNGDASPDAAASRSGGARAVLWQGYCSNGVCMECLGDGFTCGGAQQCIDGATAQTIVVDGTERTFRSNTVAGTLLAAVLMLIILQLCVCCRICQAYRYRKADQKAAMGEDDTPKVVF